MKKTFAKLLGLVLSLVALGIAAGASLEWN